MPNVYHIVVCGSVVPDPLQTLEPIESPEGPSLKNEMMLPAVLDPWASHALFEAAELAKKHPGSKVWLVSVAPKAKLQQVMMNIAQKVPFELVAIDGSSSGFTEATDVANALAEAINGIPDLEKNRMLLFGGWESASRGAGAVMQMLGEKLQVTEQFQGVDSLEVSDDDQFIIKERIEGGSYQVNETTGCPILLGWATGNLPYPKNNPQVGMMNMQKVMPALQKATQAEITTGDIDYKSVSIPKQKRETRVEKDMSADDIADEIVTWINQ